MAPQARQRPARDLARTLDRTPRDRRLRVLTDPVWGDRAPRRCSFAGPKRFQPVPVALRAMPPLDLWSSRTTTTTISTIRRSCAREELDVPFVTSLGVGAHLEAWGSARRAHHGARLVGTQELRSGLRVTAAPSQHFSGRTGPRPQLHAVVVVRRPLAAARRVLQRRHGAHHRVRRDPRAPRALRPRDARGRGVPPGVGGHPPWTGERAASPRAPRRRGFLPVHWGTFNLAIHAWDEPAETLLKLGPRTGAAGDAAPRRAGGTRARFRARRSLVAKRRTARGR